MEFPNQMCGPGDPKMVSHEYNQMVYMGLSELWDVGRCFLMFVIRRNLHNHERFSLKYQIFFNEKLKRGKACSVMTTNLREHGECVICLQIHKSPCWSVMQIYFFFSVLHNVAEMQ